MRGCGVLLHISSLPNPYGIGTFGKEAYQFVDFLKKAGQNHWQVLPLGPTSYGDSPYQTFSAFAGNPYFIDLDRLKQEKLLVHKEYQHLRHEEMQPVDYEFQYLNRFSVLKKAFERFQKQGKSEDFEQFIQKNQHWLNDYALFMAIKDVKPEGNWLGWDEPYRTRNLFTLDSFRATHTNEITFWKFIQFKFFEQWHRLKKYANLQGIQVVGDMPIYMSFDSSDVWANPGVFQLDETLKPIAVAGVPPDAFSETGQLWGNPLYRYDLMEKEGYGWWIERIRESLELCDIVRIDHFRGFEAYYAVPYGDKTAEGGKWIKGPGFKLFSKVKEALGEVNIIAEDLGFLTQEVYDLLRDCGYPGMKVLEFGFDLDGDSEHAPHNHIPNTVVYPGTHDNQPLKAWAEELSEKHLKYCMQYLNTTSKSEIPDLMIREAMKSVAKLAIVSMQDYLGLGKDARFNTPSTLGGNWVWRVQKKDLSSSLAKKMDRLATIYKRKPKQE